MYISYINKVHLIYIIYSLIFHLIYVVYIENINFELYYLIQGVFVFLLGLLCHIKYKIECIILSYERLVLFFGWFIIPFYPLSSFITVEGVASLYIYYKLLDFLFYPVETLPNFIAIPIMILLIILNYLIMFTLICLEIMYMKSIRKK